MIWFAIKTSLIDLRYAFECKYRCQKTQKKTLENYQPASSFWGVYFNEREKRHDIAPCVISTTSASEQFIESH